MNAKTSFRALFSVTLVPFALGVAELPGCGSDVATCATVCGYPDAPTGCLDTCTSNQSTCDSLGCGPTYQQSLTCYANTGSYTGGRSVCGAFVVAPVPGSSDADAGGGSSQGTFRGSGGESSTGSTSCALATCASVCATEGSAEQSCLQGCTQSQATCSADAAGFQALLACICGAGGLVSSTDTTIATKCESVLVALEASCPGLDQGSTIMVEDAGN